MSDEMKPQQHLDETLLALREDYEQTAVPVENQPKPKQGKEIKERRFPKAMSYVMGIGAVMMLVVAVFLFNLQNKPVISASMNGMTNVAMETAVDPETGLPIPTPPLMSEPPRPSNTLPMPPRPTPWPTPPIVPDSSG
jgi:hypothetical protein